MNIYTKASQQNVFVETRCGECGFADLGCKGYHDLMRGMEHRNCIPAYMALTENELKRFSKETGQANYLQVEAKKEEKRLSKRNKKRFDKK